MSVSFSLAQHTVPYWSPAEMIYNAESLGYDMVGIRMLRQKISGEVCFDMRENMGLFHLAQEALEQTSVKIHDIDLAAINHETVISSYAPYFELAQQLGVCGVVSSIWTDDEPQYLRKFADLCDLAGTYQLEVYLEFVSWAKVSSLRQAKGVLEQVNRPNASLLVDSLHYYRSQVEPRELEQCPPEWFRMMHLCGAPAAIPATEQELASTARTQRLYPGEGVIDHTEILQYMPKDLVIGLEIPNDRRRTEYGAYEFASRCLKESKEYLRRNGVIL